MNLTIILLFYRALASWLAGGDEELEKKLLEKIAETPFKWTAKETIGVEVNFAEQNPVCNVGGHELPPRLLHPSLPRTTRTAAMEWQADPRG